MVKVKHKDETIDIENLDDLYRVVKAVRREDEPLILIVDGVEERIAPAPRRRPRRTPEEREKADYEAFLSAAGSWKDHLEDPEEFMRQIRVGRGSMRTDEDKNADVTPVAPKPRRRKKELTEADYEATMSTFGAWKGLIDTEEMKKELKAARGSKRRPVEL